MTILRLMILLHLAAVLCGEVHPSNAVAKFGKPATTFTI